MIKSILSVFIILLLTATSVHAQDYIDLVHLYYSNTPQNSFKNSESQTRVQELGFSLTYPMKLKNGNSLLMGVDGEGLYSSFTDSSSSGSVGSFTAKVGYVKTLGSKWTGMCILLPKIASDFHGTINRKDFQVGTFIMFKYAKRDDFKYKLGLYANAELFGTFFVPLFGLYYMSPNKKFETDLTLPLAGDANYRLAKKMVVGARFVALVKTYNLNNYYYHQSGEYLAKTTNDLYTYLGYEFKKGIIVRGQVGYSFGRHYRIYDSEDTVDWGLSAFKFGDHRKQLNSDFQDGLLFRIDLTYRFYLK